jgi:hypothetical protein
VTTVRFVRLFLALTIGVSVVAAAAPAGAATSRWTAVPTAANASYGTLSGVSCPAPNACFAVGTQDLSGKNLKLVQRWDGKQWFAQITPTPPGAVSSHLSAVRCTSSANCIAVGQYTTTKGLTRTLALWWTKGHWLLMTTPNPVAAVSGLSSVWCTNPANCIAVGGYFTSTSNSSNEFSLALHWDGTTWSIMSTPNVPGAFDTALAGVACAAPTDCFAVGYSHTTLLTSTLVERWDGASWTILTTPNPQNSADNELAAVSCYASTRCMAAGTSDHGTLVEKWNGRDWSIAKSPNPPGATGAALTGVSCTSTARCFAAGVWFQQNVQRRLVERFTPSGNAVVKVPVPTGTTRSSLSAISCPSDRFCFAVGDYYRGRNRRPLLIRYGP